MNKAERKRTNVEINPEKRLLNTKEAASYLGVGTKRARKYCEQIGALRRFGARSVLFDRAVIDRALDAGRTYTA